MNRILSMAAAALVLVSCGGNAQRKTTQTTPQETAAADMHCAANSLDYRGTYRGTLPAADCPGIETTLTLEEDGSYLLHMEYLERATSFDERGTYAVEGNLLTLTPDDGENAGYYKVEERLLRHLDADRQPITGALADHYVLRKEQ